MRVLILAHDYPPVGGGGVQRVLHLVRSLHASDHAVHVVTVDQEPGPMRDDSLLERHPREVPITRYRLPSLRPVVDMFRAAHLSRIPTLVMPTDLYPDASIFARTTARAALEVARTFRPDVVVASAPPFGIIEAARRVGHRLGVTFVADLRDPWIEPVVARFPSLASFHWARALQRRCLRTADLVTVTARSLQALLETLPVARPRRVVTITNGFDGEIPISTSAMAEGRELCQHAQGARTVAFIGRLFTSDVKQNARGGVLANRLFDSLAVGREIVRADEYHAGPWFQALALLARRRPDLRGKIETIFVGNVPRQGDSVPEAVNAFPTRFLGYRSLAVAAAVARAADALLLLNPSTVDDSPSFIIPGKLFEYVAAGPPILTMCGPGDCADIVRATGTGVWVHDYRPKEMTDHLERWLDGRGLPVARHESSIAGYERSALGRRFVAEIERAVKERRSDLR
jgi:glycosyltransferase involved in cell wall biosynthesis